MIQDGIRNILLPDALCRYDVSSLRIPVLESHNQTRLGLVYARTWPRFEGPTTFFHPTPYEQSKNPQFMDLPSSVDDQDVVINPKVENASFRLRAYQAEMLEESLKRNIIVVQDTGSGKTHMSVC